MNKNTMPAEFDAITQRSEHPTRFTIIALATRPGIYRFFMTLEYEYFPPGTPMHEEYDQNIVQWADLVWCVVIIPLAARDVAHRVATQTGMRIADGVPTLFNKGVPPRWFPVQHRRAYSLENDTGSPLYFPGGEDFIRAEERRWLIAFWKARGCDEHGNPL